MRWARQSTTLRGTAADGALILSDKELWLENASTPVANTLLKSADYDCFIAVRLANGKHHAMTGLTVHDRGGSATVQTPEEPSRQLTIILRHGLWPSNSGNNFMRVLNLYLLEAGKEYSLGNGWGTPQSGHVGFGIGDQLPGGQQASARCEKIQPPVG